METKKEIRQRFLEKRKAMSSQEVRKASDVIMQKIINLDEFKNAKNILLYYSIDNEVVTHELINYALENGKNISLPKVIAGFSGMEIYLIKSTNELILNSKFGVSEPNNNICKRQPINELDLIVIPGVVFDKKYNRLGRGKGCYDKFLINVPKNIFKLGICFLSQIYDEILPVGEFDIKMDFVVTER